MRQVGFVVYPLVEYQYIHRFPMYLPGDLYETILAGTPATVAFSGTSFTTTAPAPIVALFQTFFPTVHFLLFGFLPLTTKITTPAVPVNMPALFDCLFSFFYFFW